MSFNDTRTAIETRFAEGWTAGAYSSVPVWYANQPAPRDNDSYLALSIVGTGGNPASIGAPDSVLDRFTGFAQVDVLVPANTGEAQALKMADLAAGILRRAELSHGESGSIVFGIEGEPVRLPHPGKYRVTVRIPYRRDIIR